MKSLINVGQMLAYNKVNNIKKSGKTTTWPNSCLQKAQQHQKSGQKFDQALTWSNACLQRSTSKSQALLRRPLPGAEDEDGKTRTSTRARGRRAMRSRPIAVLFS